MSTITSLKVRTLTPMLTVNNLTRSIQFYRDALGFKVKEEMKHEGEVKGVTLEAKDATLGLSQDDFSKGRDRVKGVGMRFYLETDQDIDELGSQVKAAGFPLNEGPGKLPWGQIGFTVTDPDGFKITVANPE